MRLPRQNKNSRVKQHLSNLAIRDAPYYLYLLWCPLAKRVKYVGFTAGAPWSRLNNHISEARHPSSAGKSQWIKGLLSQGLLPTMRLVAAYDNEAEAIAAELALIQKVSTRRPLLNRAGMPEDRRVKVWPGFICKMPDWA